MDKCLNCLNLKIKKFFSLQEIRNKFHELSLATAKNFRANNSCFILWCSEQALPKTHYVLQLTTLNYVKRRINLINRKDCILFDSMDGEKHAFKKNKK
jgi:hypothetical protein